MTLNLDANPFCVLSDSRCVISQGTQSAFIRLLRIYPLDTYNLPHPWRNLGVLLSITNGKRGVGLPSLAEANNSRVGDAF